MHEGPSRDEGYEQQTIILPAMPDSRSQPRVLIGQDRRHNIGVFARNRVPTIPDLPIDHFQTVFTETMNNLGRILFNIHAKKLRCQTQVLDIKAAFELVLY